MGALKESKLIEILSILSKKEFKELGPWLQSPWGSSNKHLFPFYQIIQQSAPKVGATTLQKEAVFKQLFPKKKYNNRTFNNLILAFTKEVENYLSHLQFKEEKQQKQLLLGKAFMSRKRIDYFEESHQKLIGQIEKKEEKSANDYLLLKQLYHELYFQASAHHRYDPDTLFLEQCMSNLDAYYLLERYSYLHEQVSREKILKLPINEKNEEIATFLGDLQDYLQLPVAGLYGFRIKTNLVHDWNDYLIFKRLFLTHHVKLPFDLQQTFLFCCLNDAVDFNSKGEESAIRELYDWYVFGLEHGLLLQNEMITSITYNNIVLTACYVQQHDFLAQFIEEYGQRLPKKIQTSAKRWANAQLQCALGNYDKVTEDLKDWKPKDKSFAIQAKATLLKANFKLYLEDPSLLNLFNSYCLSFEKYIKRNQLYSKHRSTAYLKFIQLIRRLAHLAYKEINDREWSKFLKEINNESVLFGKIWLVTEIALIRKERKQKKKRLEELPSNN